MLAVKDEFAGKRGACPKCRAAIQVPTAAGPTAAATATSSLGGSAQHLAPRVAIGRRPSAAVRPAPAAATRRRVTSAAALARDRPALERQLLGGFRHDIPRVKVTALYRLGIVFAALVMILLPVAYLAVIAASGWAVYYHCVHHVGLLEMGSGRAKLLAVALYLAPVVTGAILVLFMLKPLFARSADRGRTRSLTRQGEPLLFAFVDRLCQAVGSRRPARIEIDCQLNAAAGLQSPLGNRLVLRIGAPLVAGLDVGQVAGVLAHEFGHFTQGTGMRLTYLVRAINHWFVRVVYERDGWDQWLEETANDWDFRVGWILHLSQLCVYLSRGILWLFMVVGHAACGFMLRQMEFHADAHEARLVGAAGFELTSRRLARLRVAYEAALRDLGQLVDNGRMPDDLPQLMLLEDIAFPDALVAKIEAHQRDTKTGWFDTHPADRERIRRAARQGDEAAFVDPRPATLLFTDFASIARNTTWDVYRAYYGSRFRPSLMQPTAEVLRAIDPRAQQERPPIEID